MEIEEVLVTINIHLYEPNNLYSVHAISKFDNMIITLKLKQMFFAKSNELLLNRWYYFFLPIYVHRAQSMLSLKNVK